jgi:hypothetical protein
MSGRNGMNRIGQLLFGIAFGFAGILLATARADYSGTYTAQQKAGKAASPNPVVIHVTQTDTIEIIRTEGEKSVTNRLSWDGSEADYTSPTGKRGKGWVQFKEDDLLIEWVVVSSNGDSKPIRLHTKERWSLSSDKHTLTIKSEVDSADIPPAVMAAALPNNPWTVTYQRTN